MDLQSDSASASFERRIPPSLAWILRVIRLRGKSDPSRAMDLQSDSEDIHPGEVLSRRADASSGSALRTPIPSFPTRPTSVYNPGLVTDGPDFRTLCPRRQFIVARRAAYAIIAGAPLAHGAVSWRSDMAKSSTQHKSKDKETKLAQAPQTAVPPAATPGAPASASTSSASVTPLQSVPGSPPTPPSGPAAPAAKSKPKRGLDLSGLSDEARAK